MLVYARPIALVPLAGAMVRVGLINPYTALFPHLPAHRPGALGFQLSAELVFQHQPTQKRASAGPLGNQGPQELVGFGVNPHGTLGLVGHTRGIQSLLLP